jgi:hypothetical protein
MINKINGFEKGEIKKADISAGFSRLAPLIVKISKRFYRRYRKELSQEFMECLMMVEVAAEMTN